MKRTNIPKFRTKKHTKINTQCSVWFIRLHKIQNTCVNTICKSTNDLYKAATTTQKRGWFRSLPGKLTEHCVLERNQSNQSEGAQVRIQTVSPAQFFFLFFFLYF